MCGISGTFASMRSERESQDAALVSRVVDSQYSRGPDVLAVEAVRGRYSVATLGHNRLTIIDRSTAANQPMWDADRRLCLVYNGEIYNYVELREELSRLGHRFITRSDSEAIL